jgi:signal transduction histidine kinase
VALGIVGRPELLFLDEPTTGFDPEARRAFWELVRSLAADGTSILLTTHYLDEAEALADRVAVVHRGRVVASGPPADLAGRGSAPARVSHNSEIVLLRAAQEALSNAGRHATARSVQVTLTFADQDVLLVVRDDGVGFAPAQAQGFGLTQMQERAVQVGGRAEVKSTPGRGSEVRVSVPLLGLSPGCAPEPAVNNGEPRGEAVRQ